MIASCPLATPHTTCISSSPRGYAIAVSAQMQMRDSWRASLSFPNLAWSLMVMARRRGAEGFRGLQLPHFSGWQEASHRRWRYVDAPCTTRVADALLNWNWDRWPRPGLVDRSHLRLRRSRLRKTTPALPYEPSPRHYPFRPLLPERPLSRIRCRRPSYLHLPARQQPAFPRSNLWYVNARQDGPAPH